MVFCIRYMDLFMYFISLYNTLMKIFFISATAFIIYLMRFQKNIKTVSADASPRKTYNQMEDNFPHLKVLVPAALVLTLIVNSGFSMWEFMWSYSLWLESLAFIPQIYLLTKMGQVENITSHYVACLGLYRFFYILNW